MVTNSQADPAFRALADPIRREILALLADHPLPVHAIAEEFAVSRPAVSKHLRILKQAGLVRDTPMGRTTYYRLEPEPLAEVERWVRSLWRDRLGRLKTLIEKGER
ncbi:MAG: ArsR/SmtB family transcription factor [Gemmatimonadales bacterium]